MSATKTKTAVGTIPQQILKAASIKVTQVNHLDGFTEEEKRVIKLISGIFVTSVLNLVNP